MSIPKSACDHDNAVQIGMYRREEVTTVEEFTGDDFILVDHSRMFSYYVLCCPACGAYIQTDSAGYWLDADHTLDSDFIRQRPDPTPEGDSNDVSAE